MTPSNFCIKAFNEICFDVDGTISPCCVIDGKKYKSVEDYLNSDYLHTIQNDLKNNIQTPACESCWKNESMGSRSNRRNIEKYENFKSAHIKFSNVCNFKCRMCGPRLSSAIGIEQKVKNPIVSTFSNPKIKKYFYTKLLPNLHRIYISGGEPFLSEDHLEFLQIAYKIAPRVKLNYNSNMSVTSYKGVDFRNLWEKYYRVSIQASIDGYEESQEYQRSGSVWKKIALNTIYFKKYIKEIHCTVTIYNIFHIPKLIKWCIDNDFKISFYFVDQLWLNPCILPESEKQKIFNEFDHLNNLEKDMSIEITDLLLKPLQKSPGNLQELNVYFKKYTKKLDNLRKTQSFTEINPQFKDWYERI